MSNEVGTWDSPLENALKIVGVHAVVLHTGKVLYFCFDQRAVGQLNANHDLFQMFFNDPNSGSYQIWDPAVPVAGPVQPIGRNSFCAGQCALADGTIFVAGGQDGAGAADLTGEWDKYFAALAGTDNGALKDVHTYDAVQDRWVRWPDMADGRYYPTCVTLDDGTAFVAGGLSNLMQWVASGSNWCENDQFETFPPGLLELGPSPQQKFTSADQYPIMVLLPGTRRLFVHIHAKTSIFDLDSHSFIDGAEFMPPGVGRQTYPMQTGHVLLPQKEGDPPRILIVGGSTATGFDFNTHSDAPAVRAAFIFDYNAQSPSSSRWRNTKGAPTVARLLSDTVLLPDGKVFIVNGISQGAAAGHSGPTVFQAELFDPVTETFKAMALPTSVSHPRGYHATAVLLPDARVAIAGNTETYNPGEPKANDDVSIEIFNPPYLFAGPRPVVMNVPAEIEYGSTINIDNSGDPRFERVVMMRPCAVTHSVDMNQRAIQLETSAGIGQTSDVKVPKDRSLAPPGHYMLFFLSAAGVPSKASFVQLKDLNPKFPPVFLGNYEGGARIVEAFDGDITLEQIHEHCDVTLESRHGSITINHKVDQHCYANLTAKTTVHIGQGVDQHSIVEIFAGGDVTFGEKINESSQVHVTTSGSIALEQTVDNESAATFRAGTTVHIGLKIDQHSTFDVVAEGDVTIEQTLDQHTHSTITSNKGSITVRQGMMGNAVATLRAPNGFITMDTIDDDCTLNWSARDLRCNNKKGTITRIP